ncbi:MAG TPA: hypothetical protein PKO33_15840, partial [Pyrinomonadaceae bacterium]|nr:hypothetical protein [Pyrinomonadaceae bacterium]
MCDCGFKHGIDRQFALEPVEKRIHVIGNTYGRRCFKMDVFPTDWPRNNLRRPEFVGPPTS